jgi:hypothetical protein
LSEAGDGCGLRLWGLFPGGIGWGAGLEGGLFIVHS